MFQHLQVQVISLKQNTDNSIFSLSYYTGQPATIEIGISSLACCEDR